MSRFANIRLPPLNAAVNVAGQTIRQFLPDRSNQQPSERFRFAQVNSVPNQSQSNHNQPQEHHELSNMTASTNPFLSSSMKQTLAEENCNQGYQSTTLVEGQRPSMSSVDFSEGSDFVEGRSEVKINEYQAAWNVTNAIQVYFTKDLKKNASSVRKHEVHLNFLLLMKH